LAGQQQNNGSWSPNNDEASKGYEFETTLLILESLLQYRESYQIQDPWLIEAERQGQEFLLAHHLYLEGNTAIKNDWSSFSFPPYWFYDVLTALEYFRSFKTNKDTRLQAGIDLVLKKQNKEGAWFSGKKHSGKTYFDIENSGQPSRWNTLRALRVLHWWNASN
jgi:RecA-family ATPase